MKPPCACWVILGVLPLSAGAIMCLLAWRYRW